MLESYKLEDKFLGLLLANNKMRELILKVGTMLIPLGFMVSLVDYQVYGAISFIMALCVFLNL
jgi:hypothetical protein